MSQMTRCGFAPCPGLTGWQLDTHPRRCIRPQGYILRFSPRASSADFILPADARDDPKRRPNSNLPISVAAQRIRAESNFRSSKVAEDDELRRSQLASEKLSASDVLGLVADDLGVGIGSENVEKTQSKPNASANRRLPPPSVSKPLKQSRTVRSRSSQTGNRRIKPPAERPTKTDPLTKSSGPSVSSPVTEPISTTPVQPVIQVGDLINHERYGIGRFVGLERTKFNSEDPSSRIQEFAVLEYRDGDVFVPPSHFDLISPLPRVEASKVKQLDVISGAASYPSTKISLRSRRAAFLARQRTRSKIRRQLVNLHGMYAQRTTIEREPFPINAEVEKAFDRSRSFKLTKDQKCAISQILADMSESRRPMDRLLCGDVGFGKTEVAMCAALRALLSGRQVAVLSPTTILAQQHFETFQERFREAKLSFNIACFTRFVSRKIILSQRKEILDGSVNIAIGTHSLLNDNIVFKDLGLLIVDEEHRFGVNQKEKIRCRYQWTDTLFLSATPIPRTLHLTLSGLRDASVLRTPPMGRKPVLTQIAQTGSGVVRQAICHEVERGGQVFYVVPRVEGIDATASWISDLFDDDKVRVLVAHGSMKDLEQRVWAFSKKEFNVLICTTIIENGIHMPEANTIIIQDAARFGLAQLHQLRGRVGRGEVQAFAWLLYTSGVCNSLSSLQRLNVLESKSHLGSGFAIAQKDMEIRGVGTILGVEQHGNNAVGAEEYAKMLSEELEHARTGKPVPIALPIAEQVEIFLPVSSLIPDTYVSDFDNKMMLYKRMSDSTSLKQLYDVTLVMEKMFGKMPSETRRHVSLLEVKLFAKDLGIRRISVERQHVVLDWPVGAAAFKRLVAFLPDKQSRERCELVEAEERAFVRGLGLCSGEMQLAKLRVLLEYFAKASEGFDRENSEPASDRLCDDLYAVSDVEKL